MVVEDLSEKIIFNQALNGGKETKTSQSWVFQKEKIHSFKWGATI